MKYNIDTIAAALGKPQKTYNGYICCCPAHDDKNPSLSISKSGNKLLLHCFAGCSFESV